MFLFGFTAVCELGDGGGPGSGAVVLSLAVARPGGTV